MDPLSMVTFCQIIQFAGFRVVLLKSSKKMQLGDEVAGVALWFEAASPSVCAALSVSGMHMTQVATSNRLKPLHCVLCMSSIETMLTP
jgi:hypothetical protein